MVYMPSQWNRWKNIMKAYPFSEDRLAKWSPPYICQPKYDGIRCRAIPLQTGPNEDEYLLVSSEENPIFSVPHINNVFSSLKLRSELDGELYCHGMSFEQITSITSRTVNIHPDNHLIKFHCFDIINERPQMHRTVMIENFRDLDPHLIIAPFYLCESLDDVMRAYDKIIEQGYEGIIVRNIFAQYERKRSTNIMKFKPKQSDTYEIIGTVEEYDKDGNPKDSLGALICNSGDGNTFRVGTGFSEEHRKSLWDSRDNLPGKVAHVQFQHLTTGKQVPRFPVFVEVI